MVGPIFIAKLALRGCTITDRIKYADALLTGILLTGISEEVMKEPTPNVPIPEILIPTLRVK